MSFEIPAWEVLVMVGTIVAGFLRMLHTLRANMNTRSHEMENRVTELETLCVDKTGAGPLLLAHVATKEDLEHKMALRSAELVETVRGVGTDITKHLDKLEKRSDERMGVIRDDFKGIREDISGVRERVATIEGKIPQAKGVTG